MFIDSSRPSQSVRGTIVLSLLVDEFSSTGILRQQDQIETASSFTRSESFVLPFTGPATGPAWNHVSVKLKGKENAG